MERFRGMLSREKNRNTLGLKKEDFDVDEYDDKNNPLEKPSPTEETPKNRPKKGILKNKERETGNSDTSQYKKQTASSTAIPVVKEESKPRSQKEGKSGSIKPNGTVNAIEDQKYNLYSKIHKASTQNKKYKEELTKLSKSLKKQLDNNWSLFQKLISVLPVDRSSLSNSLQKSVQESVSAADGRIQESSSEQLNRLKTPISVPKTGTQNRGVPHIQQAGSILLDIGLVKSIAESSVECHNNCCQILENCNVVIGELNDHMNNWSILEKDVERFMVNILELSLRNSYVPNPNYPSNLFNPTFKNSI